MTISKVFVSRLSFSKNARDQCDVEIFSKYFYLSETSFEKTDKIIAKSNKWQ